MQCSLQRFAAGRGGPPPAGRLSGLLRRAGHPGDRELAAGGGRRLPGLLRLQRDGRLPAAKQSGGESHRVAVPAAQDGGRCHHPAGLAGPGQLLPALLPPPHRRRHQDQERTPGTTAQHITFTYL